MNDSDLAIIIYLLGGFARHLAKVLKGSRSWDAITAVCQEGGVIVGRYSFTAAEIAEIDMFLCFPLLSFSAAREKMSSLQPLLAAVNCYKISS